MKHSYFLKTTGFIFLFLLLLAGNSLFAQNKSFLDFDGSNDYVKYMDDATLGQMDGATNYTIEAWIYPVDGRVAEYDRILQRYYSFAIVMYDENDDGKVKDWYFQVYDKSTSKWKYFNTEGDNTLTLNAWNHIAVVNNSSDGTLKLYVNDVDVTNSGGYPNRNMPSSTSNDNLYIGQKGSGASYFGGYIDEIRIENTTETSSTLQHQIYDNQYASDNNTAALFHFNEGSTQYTKNEASGTNAILGSSTDGDAAEPAWRAWSYVSSRHLPLAHEWKGTDAAWNTASNWEGGVPASGNDVIIPSGTTNDLSVDAAISSPAQCNNLTLESSAKLTIPAGKALTVNGDFTNNATAADLTVSSDATSGNGSLIVNGTVTGSATVQRYMTSYTSNTNGWHLISSPVANFTISGSAFVPTTGDDDLYKFDEAASSNNWLNYNGGTFGDTQFEVGLGYLVSYKTAATKNFTGVINVGTVIKNLTYTTGSAWQGWNLLGNPYTAAIDWDNLTKTSSVDGSVYVLKAGDDSYISWNGSTGGLTDGIIPAMQGYFVHVTATGQSVTMETADEVHSSTPNYKAGKTLPAGTFKITVSGNNGSSNEYIQFRNDATTGFDPAIDAYKLFGYSTAPQIYTTGGKTKYSINCLPADISNYNLPLSVKFSESGDYTLSFSGLDNVSNYSLVLEDLQSHEMISLNSGTTYSFNLKKDDSPDRFALHINGVTAVPNVNKTDGIQVFAYGNTVYLHGQKALNGKVSIFNTLGQKVYEGLLNGAAKQQIRLSQRAGIYFVRVEENSHLFTRKVFIK